MPDDFEKLHKEARGTITEEKQSLFEEERY